MTNRRRELLVIMAGIEYLMSEVESITVGETNYEILLRTSKLLASIAHAGLMWSGR
jgi:hypothetical protein